MSDEREVQEILARYVRAADRRDGAAEGALFTDDAIVQIYTKTGPDTRCPVGEPMIGGESVRYAVENFMAPRSRAWVPRSHHITADHIIEVRGDEAHMNAQFIVFRILGDARPADGWPEGALGAQGTVQPIESGYYDTDLRRIDGEWKIVHHRIWLDLPMALPGV